MIVIIGAGPAGLAAARAASKSGRAVTILDSSPRIGGQYWRHRTAPTGYKSEKFLSYQRALRGNDLISHIAGAHVWAASNDGGEFVISYLIADKEYQIRAEKIILATGAYDRALPFDGWDRPGSMTAGGAQAMLKGQGVLPGKRIVVAGTGPFLLPVATGLLEAGAEVVALCEANSRFRWALSPFALALNLHKVSELLHYSKILRRFKVSPMYGWKVTEFNGNSATLTHLRTGKLKTLECDVVATGWGFLPDVTLAGIFECAQEVDATGAVVVSVDGGQRSSATNVWCAGEVTGIGGAELSLIEGEIAGLAAAGVRIPIALRYKRFARKSFARALARSYPVSNVWAKEIAPQTNVCRCEEVSAGEIRSSMQQLNASDARSSKLFTRAGMGLCQGRICSRNVGEFISCHSGKELDDKSRITASNRPIASPISLGNLGDGLSNH